MPKVKGAPTRTGIGSSSSSGGSQTKASKKRKASEALNTEDTFSRAPRRSNRVEEQRTEAMQAYELATGPATSQYDRTPHFARPLEIGSDGRGYTSTPARAALNRDIEASAQTYPSLEAANAAGAWPAAALKLDPQARRQGSVRVEGRSPATGFVQGHDSTLTFNRGHLGAGGRTAADTPEPRSPRPSRPDTRYERAHTAPFASTGAAGNTVWAPTQANQVIDTHHERHAGVANGRLFRQDTYTDSTLYSARPVNDGVEIKQSHYRRRY